MVAVAHSAVPGSATSVVAARGAAKVFETGDGISGLDLEVPRGTILGLVGPSGSGKTTAVRLMTGVLEPTSGQLEVLGVAPQKFDSATRQRLGYMPQQSVLYPNLSVSENLDFFSSLYGRQWRNPEALSGALDFVELTGHESKRVADISGGMKRRLALAATLIHSPELIFLDEPTAGIDPILRRKFWDHFTSLKDDDRTLVVTTQYVGEAAYCDYVAVLADGELLMVETPDGLRRAAFGGDIIDLQLTHRPDPGLVDRIRLASTAMDCQPVGVNGLRLVVEEAAIALPELSAWLGDNEIGIEQAEEWFPPFDDVFVELVSKHRTDAELTDV